MRKAMIAFLAAGLIGCLPKPESSSGIRSITGPDFKGKKYYFAFNGSDAGSMSPTVFEPMFDANNLGAVFSRSSGGNYSTDITYDTTKVNSQFLLAKLDEYAAKLGPDDMFIMYTGSHGSREGLYLGGETVAYEKIVQKVMRFRAKEVIIFMMACHSGAFSNAITAQHGEYAKWSREGRTLFVLASSQADQTSSTFPEAAKENAVKNPLNAPGNTGTAYGNVLWRAIRGDADANGDKKVTLKETFDFVTTQTQKLAAHRPAFAGDFPHNLVLTLVEGSNASEAKADAAGIDGLVVKIKGLEKKIEDVIARIYELNLQLNPAGDELVTGGGSDGADGGDGEVDAVGSDESVQPTPGASRVFAVISDIRNEKRKSADTPAEVQKQGSAIGQMLTNLSSAIREVLSVVTTAGIRVQLQTLERELTSLHTEYNQAVEELRLKVAESLANRP